MARQMPLTTCTTIRREPWEREKISMRPIHWVNESPWPPYARGAAIRRKPRRRSSAHSRSGTSPVASIRPAHSSPGPVTHERTCSRSRSYCAGPTPCCSLT
jgi:hypothetical protein